MTDKAVLLRPARVWTDGETHDGWSALVRGRMDRGGWREDRCRRGGGDRSSGHDAAARTDGPAFASLPASLQRDAVGRSGAERERGLSHRARGTPCARRRCARGSRRCAISAPKARAMPTSRSSARSTKGSCRGRAWSSSRARSSRQARMARRARNSVPIAVFRKARKRRAASTRSCARCAIRRAMARTGSRSMPIIAPARAARRSRRSRSMN